MNKVTLATLSKELNLSVSTISKALGDSHEISAATKKIVLAKAREKNYQVNPFASSLRKQKSKTIAVVLPEIANNFFSLAINGIESVAQAKGYHVLIYITHEDAKKEETIIGLLQNGRVDGIMISLSSDNNETAHIEELKKKEIPFVFFDRVTDSINAHSVTTDNRHSGFLATEHLIENGCGSIAFLSMSDKLLTINKRFEGYREALKKHGFMFDKRLVIACGNDEEKNKLLIKKFLRSSNRPDGLLASVEKLALQTYEVCGEEQIAIPGMIKIVGFSNMQMASLLHPPMTTVTQPAYDIGKEAALILFRLIEGKSVHLISKETVLESSLIVRESTKKCADRTIVPTAAARFGGSK